MLFYVIPLVRCQDFMKSDDSKAVLVLLGIHQFVNKARGVGTLKILRTHCDAKTI
jgi:hypothetical protein